MGLPQSIDETQVLDGIAVRIFRQSDCLNPADPDVNYVWGGEGVVSGPPSEPFENIVQRAYQKGSWGNLMPLNVAQARKWASQLQDGITPEQPAFRLFYTDMYGFCLFQLATPAPGFSGRVEQFATVTNGGAQVTPVRLTVTMLKKATGQTLARDADSPDNPRAVSQTISALLPLFT